MMPKSTPHTLEDFELELQSLRGSVLAMGRIAMEMVTQIGDLLSHNLKPNVSKAKKYEKELDQLEAEIDQQARIIIIKYQPVATDLRGVTGAVRMATDFEQIGDDARRVLINAADLDAWISYDTEQALQHQWQLSHQGLKRAYQAYVEHEPAEAAKVGDSKSKIRKLANAARTQISLSVAKNQSLAPSFVEAVNATHALENIGLHACSLGEAVVFIETATDRRDRRGG